MIKKYSEFLTENVTSEDNFIKLKNIREMNVYLLSGAYHGTLHVVKYALEHGADINYQSGYNNPLICAIKNKHNDIVKYLIEKNADVHMFADFALHSAVLCDNIEGAKILLENGAQLRQQIYDERQSDEMKELLNQYDLH